MRANYARLRLALLRYDPVETLSLSDHVRTAVTLGGGFTSHDMTIAIRVTCRYCNMRRVQAHPARMYDKNNARSVLSVIGNLFARLANGATH